MRKLFITLFFCLLTALINASQRHKSKDNSERDGKVFSLFTVVNFKNEPCQSTDSLSSGSTPYRNGTCFTSSECQSKGGSSKGGCAAGFGVCCVFVINDSSSTTISQNDTYIQNPGYPSQYGETNTLSYTINKCSDDICWLRLDFETFNTVAPTDTTEGDVATPKSYACNDPMTITTTSGQSIPELCGDLTGQHIYVDLGTGASDSATLALAFQNANTNRKWDIKVAQIPCGATYAPQSECLQWQTGLSGQITTFNFPDTDGPHLPNQNYNHCIRQASGYCCIEYSVCSTDADNFSLDNEKMPAADMGTSLLGTECLAVGTGQDTTTTGDYIVIEGSGGTCGTSSLSKYCGQKLNPITAKKVNIPICDCTPPFSVGIFTDSWGDAQSAMVPNRGICLNYRQLPCTNTT